VWVHQFILGQKGKNARNASAQCFFFFTKRICLAKPFYFLTAGAKSFVLGFPITGSFLLIFQLQVFSSDVEEKSEDATLTTAIVVQVNSKTLSERYQSAESVCVSVT